MVVVLVGVFLKRQLLPHSRVVVVVVRGRPVLLRQSGAEPQCVLYGPVTQLGHHNSLGQAGLSSICHLEKHHCVKGEGCDRRAPAATATTANPSPRLLAPHLFHLSQNNRKSSGESLGLNLTRARRMRKHL